MSNDELIKAEEELLALTKAKAAKLKAEFDEAQKIEAEKEMESKVRAKVEAEINAKQDSGIVESGSLQKKKENGLTNFHKSFMKRHGYKPVEYGSTNWVSGYEFTDSDTGCSNDVSAWTPDEVFSNLIWSAFYCKGYLAGKVTVRGVDFARGKGDTVSIRMRSKRTAQGPLDPCECLSCVSSSFTKVSLKLDSYGDLAEICELDLQLAGDVVKDGIIEDMSDALAEQVDLEIYNQLITAAAGYTDTLDSCCSDPSLDSCCFDTLGLYNAIVKMEASMREGGVRPDFIILAPSVAAHFKYKEAAHMQGLQISFSGNELSKIGNMSVIEFPCANTCDGAAGVVAVLIDSRRAVGEGWGMKPKLEQDRNIDCDSTTVAIHMYVGIDELDVNAIGLISAPSC
jgi:hypothetical protein